MADDDGDDVSSHSRASNLSSSFSTSDSSSCRLQQEVMDQFELLAKILRDTNQNLHTFEFMVGHYQRMAKVQPFIVNGNEGAGSAKNGAESEDVLDQLRHLSEAVGQINTLGKSNIKLEEELRQTRVKVISLESEISNAKAELLQERESRQMLEKSLDAEKSAAKKIAKDITFYVEGTKKLERKLKELTEENDCLKAIVSEGRRPVSDIEGCSAGDVSVANTSADLLCRTCMSGDNDLIDVAFKVENLAKAISSQQFTTNSNAFSQDATVKLAERNRLLQEELKNERSNSLRNEGNYVRIIRSLHSGLSDSLKSVAESILKDGEEWDEKKGLEENFEGLENGKSFDFAATEEAVRRLLSSAIIVTSKAKAKARTITNTEKELKSVRLKLNQELSAKASLEKEHGACGLLLKEYEDQVSECKRGLEILQSQLQKDNNKGVGKVGNDDSQKDNNNILWLQEVNSIKCRLAKAKAESRNLAFREAANAVLIKEQSDQLEQATKSLRAIKIKSKALLKQYRCKRQTLNDVLCRMTHVKKCLMELRDLCASKDKGCKEVMRHFGGQIEITANLLAVFLNQRLPPPIDRGRSSVSSTSEFLAQETEGLCQWFQTIQALSSWTHSNIAAFASIFWKKATRAITPSEEPNNSLGDEQRSLHSGPLKGLNDECCTIIHVEDKDKNPSFAALGSGNLYRRLDSRDSGDTTLSGISPNVFSEEKAAIFADEVSKKLASATPKLSYDNIDAMAQSFISVSHSERFDDILAFMDFPMK